MAEPTKRVEVKDLKEVEDLSKAVLKTTDQIDEKYRGIADAIKLMSEELSISKKRSKENLNSAKVLSKQAKRVLNYTKSQNVFSKIGLMMAKFKLKHSKDLTTEHKKQLKDLIKQSEEMKKSVSLGAKLKDTLKGGLQAIKGKVAAAISLGAIIATVVKTATRFAGMLDAIGNKFGSLNLVGEDLKGILNKSTAEVEKFGFAQADVLNTTSDLSSEYGFALDKAAELSVKVLETAKATGISADESTKLFGILKKVVGLTEEESEHLIKSTASLARAKGVAPQAVLKDLASSSETMAKYTKGTGANLFQAAIAARKLGLSIESIAKSGRASLDMESSLTAQYELQALSGKNINLQKARQLFYEGDIAGYQRELKNELGKIGKFSEQNVFTQEAMMKLSGMNADEIVKLQSETGDLTKELKGDELAAKMASGELDNLAGVDAQSKVTTVTNLAKSLATTFSIEVGPAIETAAGAMLKWAEDSKIIESIEGKFRSFGGKLQDIAGSFSKWIENMPTLQEASEKALDYITEKLGPVSKLLTNIKLVLPLLAAGFAAFAAFKFAGMLTGLKKLFALMKGKSLMSGLSAILSSAAFGPIGIAATVAAALAGYATFRALTKTADDFKSGPGGINYMSGPAGAFTLNPRDSVLATTNPIPVNDFQTGDAGSMRADFKSLVDAQKETTQAINMLQLSTTVTNRQQRITLEGTFNQLGGADLITGGGAIS